MKWRRGDRPAQERADRLDAALSAGPPGTDFVAELGVARAIEVATAAELTPPSFARAAMRAGLAARRHRRPAVPRRAAVALGAMATAAAAVLALVVGAGAGQRSPSVSDAFASLNNLANHVKGLEAAIQKGDATQVRAQLADAQAAAKLAQAKVDQLPPASRQAAVALTQQDLNWLVNATQASVDGKPSSPIRVPEPTPGPPPGATTAPTGATTAPTGATTAPPGATTAPTTAPPVVHPATTTTVAPTTTTTTTAAPTTTTTVAPTTTAPAPTTTTTVKPS